MSFVKDMIAKVAKASGGVQTFHAVAANGVYEVQIEINPDAENILAIRDKAQSYVYKAGELSGTPWAQWIGDGEKPHPTTGQVYHGVSPTIAARIAYADGCKVSVRPAGSEEPFERLTALDLLALSRIGGGFFTLLTEEIIGRVNGLNLSVEVEAVQKLGEDLPPTTGGS